MRPTHGWLALVGACLVISLAFQLLLILCGVPQPIPAIACWPLAYLIGWHWDDFWNRGR